MNKNIYTFNLLFLILLIIGPFTYGQSPEKDTILIDLGSTPSPSPWNNLNNAADGAMTDLINSHGYTTSVGIMVIDSFNGVNTAGTQEPEASAGIPPTASSDSFFGNVTPFGGQIQPTGALRIHGLTSGESYTVSIFASRVATDNRETQYIISGETIDTVYLDPASNIGDLATYTTTPDTSGAIEIHVAPGPNNTNGSGFYYIGAIKVEYDHDPSVVPMDTVLVDLGNNFSPLPWNNLTNPSDGSISNLINTRGLMTAYNVMVSDSFNNINTGGTQEPDSTLGYPPTATGDSFFGNVTPFGGQVQPSGALDFTNLNPDKSYTFTIFSSRSATDNREAQYALSGSTQDTLYLNASDNTANVVSATLFPDENGTIRIKAEPGPNNDNGSGFYYLGLVTMSYSFEDIMEPEPESDTLEVLIDFGNNLSPSPWNNVEDPVAGIIDNLVDINNDSTGFYISITDDFNNINTGGTQNPSEEIGIPPTASGDSFFGNVAEFGGQMQPTAGLEIGNLDPATSYQLSIFASREASDNREAQYIITGNSIDTIYLDAASNTDQLAITDMLPSADGIIKIDVSPGPNNSNSSGFYYLGAIKMKYLPPVQVSPFDTLLIDFGTILSPDPWNNMTDAGSGDIADIIKSDGFLSGYGIRVTDPFTGVNDAGSQSPNPETGISPEASGDSFYGSTELWSGTINPTGAVQLYNLNPDKEYEVFIYASRVATDNRETKYVVEGATVDSFLYQVSSNTDSIIAVTLQPNVNGEINVMASPGPNNNNSYGFFYLGAMKVVYEHEEPSDERELSLIRPNGGEIWRVGDTAQVKWQKKNIAEVILDYSTDNGTTWQTLDTIVGGATTYDWAIPDEMSDECLVRLTSDTLEVISAANFSIGEPATAFKIAILGSSTAAGTGASPDSSWVERYADYLKYDTKFEVTNFARGGYNTFRILPTGTETNSGETIDETRNVTAALAIDPCAIIVNMPSNDAAGGYDAATQLSNFEAVANAAQEAGTQIWIATTQPRNFTNQTQIDIQTEVRDSILSIYGENAIDFWTGIANEENTILEEVDSGDGVHLNNKGHKILFERVKDKGIDNIECTVIINTEDEFINGTSSMKVFPNPTDGQLFLELETGSVSTINVELINTLGQRISNKQYTTNGSGLHQLNITPEVTSNGNPTLYYLVVTIKENNIQKNRSIPVIIK